MTDLKLNAAEALRAVREAQEMFEKHEEALGDDGENIATLIWSAEIYLAAALDGDVFSLHCAEALRDDPYYRNPLEKTN